MFFFYYGFDILIRDADIYHYYYEKKFLIDLSIDAKKITKKT